MAGDWGGRGGGGEGFRGSRGFQKIGRTSHNLYQLLVIGINYWQIMGDYYGVLTKCPDSTFQ